jgi:hypothetical protein
MKGDPLGEHDLTVDGVAGVEHLVDAPGTRKLHEKKIIRDGRL